MTDIRDPGEGMHKGRINIDLLLSASSVIRGGAGVDSCPKRKASIRQELLLHPEASICSLSEHRTETSVHVYKTVRYHNT
jgi:hypothetical protein